MFWNNKKKEIHITGMKCEGCTKAIKRNLETIPEISKVKINLSKNNAIITYKGTLDNNDITRKIEELDYQVTEIKDIN